MAAILQMTFSNAFSWIKFTVFYSYFIKTYSQGSNYEYAIIGSDDGLTPCRRQAIIWTNDGLGWWHICASLGLNELTMSIMGGEGGGGGHLWALKSKRSEIFTCE